LRRERRIDVTHDSIAAAPPPGGRVPHLRRAM
jgi:hypothetical protein